MLQSLLKGIMGSGGRDSTAPADLPTMPVPNHSGLEKKIVELMAADYSWEQVLYDMIAAEGLDPWNLDLNILSSSFLSYMGKVKELDFRIPAKYVIISSVLLKMKSDNLRLIDIPTDGAEIEAGEELVGQPYRYNLSGLNLNSFDLHGRRRPTKPIMVTDLVRSLKRMLDSQQLRDFKIQAARSAVKISTESITERIDAIYSKINNFLGRMKTEEVKFSEVVGNWERKSVVEHFLPIIYLDNENKVDCRQDNFFEEIYIKKHGEISVQAAGNGHVIEENPKTAGHRSLNNLSRPMSSHSKNKKEKVVLSKKLKRKGKIN